MSDVRPVCLASLDQVFVALLNLTLVICGSSIYEMKQGYGQMATPAIKAMESLRTLHGLFVFCYFTLQNSLETCDYYITHS